MNDDEAIEHWTDVMKQYPYTSAWGVAIYNIGIIHKKHQRYQEAIDCFERLFPSHVDDFEPSANLMQPYQNYRHNACLQISSCYEGLGDYPTALHYAELAQNTYSLQSWCLTCRQASGFALQKRIDRLRQGKPEEPVPVVQPPKVVPNSNGLSD
jgi:tetratricopeptide (TPR) repeat protein